jgi:hypothetical protein
VERRAGEQPRRVRVGSGERASSRISASSVQREHDGVAAVRGQPLDDAADGCGRLRPQPSVHQLAHRP